MKKIFIKISSQIELYFLAILAAVLNIWNVGRLGYGNSYYGAAIKSMLSSFSNFFFVSFDSTGFISVDKAPLSLWIDAISAKMFGFSGISILLPHAIEGILVTILVYVIVRKVIGKTPAFIASLAITLSPVNVAVYRNNTPDALLLVFILLGVFFIVNFFDKQKIKFLILSAVMLGLGFNTKMLQAYLVLPAIASSVLIFSDGGIWKKIRNIIFFLTVTAVVSIVWITIVDLTPANLRPFVGGSQNNSAWNLALEYNGTQRLFGENGIGGTPGFNVGQKGIKRLFTGEMGTQTGWFLAPAILYSIYFTAKKFIKFFHKLIGKKVVIDAHEILTFIAVVFFITGFFFFSYASFFHSYYLNIFAIPIVFIIGNLTYESIISFREESRDKYIFILILFAALPVQICLISQANYAVWLIPLITIFCLISLLLLATQVEKKIIIVGFVMLFISLFFTPLIWSGYTTFYGNTATSIFVGGPSSGGGMGGPANGGPGGGMFDSRTTNDSTLEYLKANYSGEKYFVAVSSQQQATSFILNNNIGNVMNLGGFSGRDKAITLSELKEKIKNSEIRFFLIDNQGNSGGPGRGIDDGGQGDGMFNANEDIGSWIKSNCKNVENINGLYDCKN
jgi:4-amino-4-deoxy-L-arabinose transferase-like glycosyltransferase